MDTDAALEATLRSRLGARHPRFAAAAIAGEQTTFAIRGVAQGSDFEIGSISKGITGLLSADACLRGEISPATPLGELLPLGDCEAAGASLGALSRHASALPRLPPRMPGTASPLRRTSSLFLRGQNPYGESLAELLAQARAVRLRPPRPPYSNLGFELLGHAIAAGAGMSYRDLVTARLCGPLALARCTCPPPVANWVRLP